MCYCWLHVLDSVFKSPPYLRYFLKVNMICLHNSIFKANMSLLVPPEDLFPLLSAMKNLIVVHHNKIRFAHQYLEYAVISRYPLSHQLQQSAFWILRRYSNSQHYYDAQCKLVEYLSHQSHQSFNESIAFELPWILHQIIKANPSTTR